MSLAVHHKAKWNQWQHKLAMSAAPSEVAGDKNRVPKSEQAHKWGHTFYYQPKSTMTAHLDTTWILTCWLSGLSAVTRSPEGSSPGERSFSTTFSCRSVSSFCSTGKKTPHISFRMEQGLSAYIEAIQLLFEHCSQQSSQEVRDCCSSSSAEAEMFIRRFFKERAVRSGPAALALNLEVSMLRPAKWHKLHAVIIPQRHVKPDLGSLLRQKNKTPPSLSWQSKISPG